MSGKVEKSWSTGEYGATVSVKKFAGRRSLYLVWYDPKAPAGEKRAKDGTVVSRRGNLRKESLGHADWDAAKRKAKHIQRELEAALEAQHTGTLTLTALFEKYEAAVIVPRVEQKTRLGKKTDELAEARRRAELWKAYVRGIDPKAFRDVRRLNHDLIDLFVADRRAGRVHVPNRELRGDVTDTTIGADITFLNTCLNHAAHKKRRWIPENPIAGYGVLRNARPLRIWASWDWYEAVRPYADRIDDQGLLGFWLDLAFGTGWRNTAICEFRPCDYDPKRDPVRWPYGRLHKRWETDKEMDGRWVPIDSEHTRASVEMLIRKGGAVGESYAFRAPRSDAPWDRHYVAKLLKRLVDTANLERSRAAGVVLLGYFSARREEAFRDAVKFLLPQVDGTTAARLREAVREQIGNRSFMIRLLREVVTELNRERAQAAGVLWIPYVNAHAVRRGWENDRRHHPEKARMDAQGRKDPRSLRNCYLTEDPEEIALAVTQPVRKLGIVVQGGRSRP
jgi:hypothetical protein